MSKKQMRGKRSALSLMASGVATITISQTSRPVKIYSTAAALKADRDAISGDARRAYKRRVNELAHT